MPHQRVISATVMYITTGSDVCQIVFLLFFVSFRFLQLVLRQSLRVGGFPFDVRMEQPNKETIAAMLEAERIARDPSVKRYSDVEEALKALKA